MAPALFQAMHDDVIKWKHLLSYWPFVWGIHQSPVNSPHKCQLCGALMFSLICTWINSWVNNREAGDLRCYHAHYEVIVIEWCAVYSGGELADCLSVALTKTKSVLIHYPPNSTLKYGIPNFSQNVHISFQKMICSYSLWCYSHVCWGREVDLYM